jgi:hypothetical protein
LAEDLFLIPPKNGRIKTVNRRGRRARRDKSGQRLKAQDAREKAAPFSMIPRRTKLPRGFQKMISALSASSWVILLFSSAEDPGKERFLFLKRRKEPQTAEIREDAERMKYSTNDSCF